MDFVMNKDDELTTEVLFKFMQMFQTEELPKLIKWQNYYMGKQKIMTKNYSDPTKPCNRICVNFADNIVNTFCGYLTGNPISYSSSADIQAVQRVLSYNDVGTADSEFLRNALIFGKSYELQYIDMDGKPRFSQISPLNSFCIFDDSLNRELLYFVRFYEESMLDETDNYIVEIYAKYFRITYEMTGKCGSLKRLYTDPQYFLQVPCSVFELNRDGVNIFDKIISMQDAYNELISSETDDYQAFVDAYLCLSSMDADSEEIEKMREQRVLLIPDGGQASYLIKETNDAQISNMLENLKQNIHKISCSPDMSSEDFLAQSGVSIRYKLLAFENAASNIAANFKKALQKRVELIVSILNIKAESEALWRDIDITIGRNLPEDITEKVNVVKNLTGIVSDKTLLAQLPFVKDPAAELEAVSQQKEKNMELYSFSSTGGQDSENEGE